MSTCMAFKSRSKASKSNGAVSELDEYERRRGRSPGRKIYFSSPSTQLTACIEYRIDTPVVVFYSSSFLEDLLSKHFDECIHTYINTYSG